MTKPSTDYLNNKNHTFVIAEAGSNWRTKDLKSSIKRAKKMISIAAKSGADAIKFQTYSSDRVYVPKNIASAHINIDDGISRVLALADIAWRPNDDEMKNISFDDYDWSKWKK